ncbi:MAG: RNA 2',3'-cyclic phosphodiesterase [Gemmatimonadota bacterium]|nr:RNA 2',3'-cyclic phosphodiesterase [Gemmatimonadota bacterium]MDE3216523.1 RNA 2',3'-cyclic phosphodiesterase [Gemmatimonadota bacterium]
MRLFLAVNFDAATRRAVYEAAAPLRAAAPGLAWVDEARLHLTLKFLDEQPAEAVPGLAAAADAVAARHDAVPSALQEFGAFPNFRRARVVWIGVAADPRLELLHHDVEVACEALGHAVEARPFRPHVTLARVKRPDPMELRALAREARRAAAVRFPVAVRSVDLMRSTLAAEGPAYERLHSSYLRER